jgi:ATP-dependent Clp protease ATP-binding subunit ClpA
MLERMVDSLTERAARVVAIAQGEARARRRGCVGTEHVLLGLIQEEDGLAAGVLRGIGITADRVRDWSERPVRRSAERGTFTEEVREMFELALQEATSLGYSKIDTEHMLLALVHQGERGGAPVLSDLQADPEKIRDEVVRLLSETSSRQPPLIDVDVSWLDFTADEMRDITLRIAPFVREIRLEVRHHAQAMPTFRITCRLCENGRAIRDLAALEAMGIRGVLDTGDVVRLGHVDQAA